MSKTDEDKLAVMPRFELERFLNAGQEHPLALPYHGPVALLEAPKEEDEDC